MRDVLESFDLKIKFPYQYLPSFSDFDLFLQKLQRLTTNVCYKIH